MNQLKFCLNVYWLTEDQGGRKLPPGEIYIGDVDVEDDIVTHRWCFRIISDNRPVLGKSIKAEGEFLLDTSPFHLMKKGKIVLFFEGGKLVAIGTNISIITAIQQRVKVSINWLRPEEEEREMIFDRYHYRPTIIIPNDDANKHWSFGFDFCSLPEYDQSTLAEGYFLVKFLEDAPWETMGIGTEFWVMEGSKKIGHGSVIEECREIDVRELPSYKTIE